jgi:dTDP-4-amino-4,6-dideoxygalactose transaminase
VLTTTSYRVRFVNPQEHYRRLKPEIDHAITDTLARGDLVLRQQLRDFESHFARFVGARYCVGLASGYHALLFSLVAAGIGAGDEVITVAHTFVATVSAIIHAGATPRLIDVDADYNMAPGEIERAITPRTKAIMPVHLNGRLCDMDRIQEIASRHHLIVIEDAAQALGATYKGRMAGTFGRSGCFSFYPFKALGGLGDGGAITTDDPEFARQVTLMRFNGEDRVTGDYHLHGQTALLDNVQAAVLDVKLRHLPDWIGHRRAIAEAYRERLLGLPDLHLPHFADDRYADSFQNYVIRTPRRDALREYLRSNGVETLVHWTRPMWRHAGLGLGDLTLPETERICGEVISLPMSAETTREDVAVATDTIREFFRAR